MKKIIGLIICLALVVILKNPISIGMMYVVDFIGNTFNITTVEVIDFLNEIYYFSIKFYYIVKLFKIYIT